MKYLLSLIFCAVLLVSAGIAQLPFKYDSLYKTIYAKDLCKLAQKNSNLLLIDVRSPGEYSDTSQYNSLNLGHLKGAINIEIAAIQKDIGTIDKYKDRTIVFYCSHSQRSRRVSKLLSEKGYTNFYNLNGGMSVLTQLSETDFPCKKEWIESSLPYKNLSFVEVASVIKKGNSIIIDVRPSAQFNSNDSNAENNVGRIKGAINIPYADFKQRINDLNKYKQQPILVYATSGDGDAARAAVDLTTAGFSTVYQLLGGINDFIASQEDISAIENKTAFTLMDAAKTLALLKNNKDVIIYDTRANDYFNNKVTGRMLFMNLGHIKNAVHVEEAAFQSNLLPANKNAVILIYGNQESLIYAAQLCSQGYKKVYLLTSLYDFVWSGFNVEAEKDDRQFLTDHEGLY